MKWPWISREHHQEVVAAKDTLIASLEVQNAVLAERLADPIAVTVQMPENFTLLQPAIVRRKKEQAAGPDTRQDAPQVDWSNVDPDNLSLMATLAAQEYGRLLSPVELAEWTNRVRRQIRAAKDHDNRTPQIPNVGTLETRMNSGVPDAPDHIKRMIAEAERV